MRQLLGGLLLAAGILIAGASGLCSAIYVVVGLAGVVLSRNFDDAMVMLFYGTLLLLVVGGIPFAIGTGLIMTGRRLSRDDPGGPDRA